MINGGFGSYLYIPSMRSYTRKLIGGRPARMSASQVQTHLNKVLITMKHHHETLMQCSRCYREKARNTTHLGTLHGLAELCAYHLLIFLYSKAEGLARMSDVRPNSTKHLYYFLPRYEFLNSTSICMEPSVGEGPHKCVLPS